MWTSLALLLLPSPGTHGSPLPSPSCPHQPPALHTSAWHQHLLTTQHQTPLPQSYATLSNLRATLDETVALIKQERNSYTWDLFQRTFSYKDQSLETVSYSALMPSAGGAAWVDAAYRTFQWVALGLEVVRTDLAHHDHSTRRTRALWRRLARLLSSTLELLHTELVGRGLVQEALVQEVLVQEALVRGDFSLRCIRHSVSRDTRDWLLLRHLLQEATRYSQLVDVS